MFGTQIPAYLTSQVGAALAEDAGDRVRDILAMVEESDIDEVVIEQGDLKMTVRKAGAAAAPAPAAGRGAAAGGRLPPRPTTAQRLPHGALQVGRDLLPRAVAAGAVVRRGRRRRSRPARRSASSR